MKYGCNADDFDTWHRDGSDLQDALLELRSERDKKIDALIEIFEEDIRHHRFGRKTRITFHTGGN